MSDDKIEELEMSELAVHTCNSVDIDQWGCAACRREQCKHGSQSKGPDEREQWICNDCGANEAERDYQKLKTLYSDTRRKERAAKAEVYQLRQQVTERIAELEAAQKREPLGDDQLTYWRKKDSWIHMIIRRVAFDIGFRMAERAHGIGIEEKK